MKETQNIDGMLTVIIRNDAPIRQVQDCPTYRSVRLKLTKEQKDLLKLKCTDLNFFESISHCFIEKEIK